MTDLLGIRRTTRNDLAEIDALFQRSYPALLKDHYPPSVLVTAIPLISKANPGLLASGRYFAVRDADGSIVGAGGWSGDDPRQLRSREAKAAHVRHVVTDHRRVREGIGRALIGHILEDARRSGFGRLDCLSTRMAVPFYAAAGFEVVRPVSVTLATAIEFPAVLMSMHL